MEYTGTAREGDVEILVDYLFNPTLIILLTVLPFGIICFSLAIFALVYKRRNALTRSEGEEKVMQPEVATEMGPYPVTTPDGAVVSNAPYPGANPNAPPSYVDGKPPQDCGYAQQTPGGTDVYGVPTGV